METFGKDNRKYFRSFSDLEVLYKSAGDPGFQQALTKEFSATGLSFVSPVPFKTGEVLHIKLHLKDTDTVIETPAYVVRTTESNSEFLVSLQFYDIDYHDFIRLLDYSLTFHI